VTDDSSKSFNGYASGTDTSYYGGKSYKLEELKFHLNDLETLLKTSYDSRDKEKDLVLVMDVARFKYPPFWVPLEDLWDSMVVTDKTTEASRGYFILSTYNYSKSGTENDDNVTLCNNLIPSSSSLYSHQHQH
jgi:hypothetical protein